MSKRALVERRPWLLVSILAAIGYFVLRSQPINPDMITALKGAGAAFLAVYAWQRHDSREAKLLAAVMILSALGDVLIEYNLEYGGAAFFASHVAAISLYLGNQRSSTTTSQKAAGTALLIMTPIISWLLSGSVAIGVYAVALGGMAASAWMSRFPRYRVGIGAVLFVLSDWLIFAGLGMPEGAGVFSFLVWPIYYAGQLLIATGVIQTLRKELPEEG